MFIIFFENRLVSLGNLEAAVSLLLSTPPEGSNFYPNALRAVVLSSAVSQSLHELAVKVGSFKITILQYSFLGLRCVLTLIAISHLRSMLKDILYAYLSLLEKKCCLYAW